MPPASRDAAAVGTETWSFAAPRTLGLQAPSAVVFSNRNSSFAQNCWSGRFFGKRSARPSCQPRAGMGVVDPLGRKQPPVPTLVTMLPTRFLPVPFPTRPRRSQGWILRRRTRRVPRTPIQATLELSDPRGRFASTSRSFAATSSPAEAAARQPSRDHHQESPPPRPAPHRFPGQRCSLAPSTVLLRPVPFLDPSEQMITAVTCAGVEPPF